MQKEIWKTLPIGNNKYEVSNYGRIKTHYLSEEGRIMQTRLDRLGYVRVSLRVGEKSKHFLMHRLVALMFIPNPFMYNEINHIDGNKQNNYFENLEWCTHEHNMQHAVNNNLITFETGKNHHNAKSFYQFDLNGNFVKHWDCISECARFLLKNDEKFRKEFSDVKSLRANITHVLTGKHKTCCGYIFSFNDTINPDDYIWDGSKNPIIAIDKKTGETLEFLNFHVAERTVLPNGQKPIATLICKVCRGKRTSHAGYFWKYKN
ncbi:MAG: NUMOD4 motif-containing HNH endonuclease [Clostridia bacterium]|nr:NUMOD4 motif-containing HNH endonuclease [Clostridia bacterium]